jgi:hypothetical protein
MDSSDAAAVGSIEALRLAASGKARDDKRTADKTKRAAEVVRVTEAQERAKATAAAVDALRPGAVRKFTLAVLVLIAATVATGVSIDSAAAALRVRRDVDFSTGGAADGARSCAAAFLASASARDVSSAATVASGASGATAAAALHAGPGDDDADGDVVDGTRANGADPAASTSASPMPVARVVAPHLTGLGAQFAYLAVGCATGVALLPGADLLVAGFDSAAVIWGTSHFIAFTSPH